MSRRGVNILLFLTLIIGLVLQGFLFNAEIDTNYLTLVGTIVAMTFATQLRAKDPVMNGIFQLFVGLLIIVLVNFISSMVHTRFDLTAEKRHTLSDATKTMLAELDEVVYVKVYLEGEFSADYKKLRQATKEKLDIFRAYSNGKVEYEFINPSESELEEERQEVYSQLAQEGLNPTDEIIDDEGAQGGRILWPGAIFTYGERKIPLNLIDGKGGYATSEIVIKAINDLEYNISNTIQKFTIDAQKIAVIEGHGELEPIEIADFMKSLKEYYAVERVKIDGRFKALEGFDMAIVAKPDSTFSDKDVYILDQFVMNGGRMLWLIDPTDCSMDSIEAGAMVADGNARPLGIETALFKYGVRLNNDVIMDINCARIPIVDRVTGGEGKPTLNSWFYRPLLQPKAKHPIVRNLDAIRGDFTSTLDTVGNPEVKKTILLHSSKYSRSVKPIIRISLRTAKMPKDPKLFNKSFLPVAALLEGEFESAYANIQPVGADEVPGLKPRDKSVPNKMVVIADGDIAQNGWYYDKNGEPRFRMVGYDGFENYVFANRAFLMNVVNYLLDDSGLIGLRNREMTLRLLDQTRLKEERSMWQVINVIIPLLFIALFAAIQLILRNRAYTTNKTEIAPALLLTIRLSGILAFTLLMSWLALPFTGYVAGLLISLLFGLWWWNTCGRIYTPKTS